MRATVPVVFCIDAENDEPEPDRSARMPWSWVERCFARLGDHRARLAEATGSEVAFNWMVRADPQIGEVYGDSAWGLLEYEAEWRRLLARGDEVGLHPHAQRWSGERREWSAGQADPEWVGHVLTVARDDYRRVLGRPPESMRFGNRFTSQALAAHAEALGFRHDLTIEPGYPGRSGALPAGRWAGPCPSYFRAPREPYRASPDDYLSPDPARSSGLWFIPLSTAPVGPEAPRSGQAYHRAIAPDRHPYEVLHLRIAPDLFRRAVDHLMHELARPYLAVVIRSDMIDLPEVWANLEILRSHARVKQLAFTTPSRALRLLGYERERDPVDRLGR